MYSLWTMHTECTLLDTILLGALPNLCLELNWLKGRASTTTLENGFGKIPTYKSHRDTVGSILEGGICPCMNYDFATRPHMRGYDIDCKEGVFWPSSQVQRSCETERCSREHAFPYCVWQMPVDRSEYHVEVPVLSLSAVSSTGLPWQPSPRYSLPVAARPRLHKGLSPEDRCTRIPRGHKVPYHAHWYMVPEVDTESTNSVRSIINVIKIYWRSLQKQVKRMNKF